MGLLQNDLKYVWHPFDVLDIPTPLLIKKATGVYLHTYDGRKILDGISSWWVNLHGHRNTAISKAVIHQLKLLEHSIFAGTTHKPAIDLAEILIKNYPGQLSKVFYSDNGSTAVEVALKLCIQYFKNIGVRKKKIIALEGAYHGDTFGAMACGARGVFTNPFDDFLFDVEYIPLPDASNVSSSIQKIKDLQASEGVIAFIFEPLVQGSHGMKIYEASYLRTLVAFCKSQNIFTIADEVFTGFGRTGNIFAMQEVQESPDIACLSKGLTGGYLPLGATLVTEALYQAFQKSDINQKFLHGHSYTANPLACAAGVASWRLLMSEKSIGSRKRLAGFLENMCVAPLHPKLINSRSKGALWAAEYEVGKESSGYSNSIRTKLYHYFLENNVLLRPLGNTLYVLPPYVIQDKDLRKVEKLIRNMPSF